MVLAYGIGIMYADYINAKLRQIISIVNN